MYRKVKIVKRRDSKSLSHTVAKDRRTFLIVFLIRFW